MRLPDAHKSEHDKLEGSFTKLNGSWREEEDIEPKEQQETFRPWTLQVDMRPNDYVGGYSPEWIYHYRRRHEGSKKQIKIEGYNAPGKK